MPGAARVAGLMVGDGVEVEVGESFEAREVGFGDAAGAASVGAVVDLGGEHLGEVAEVGGRSRAAISASRAASVADGGQVQLAGGGADGGLGGGVGLRRSWAAPGQQVVVAVQGRGGAVVAGQGTDRDHRRDLPARPGGGRR